MVGETLLILASIIALLTWLVSRSSGGGEAHVAGAGTERKVVPPRLAPSPGESHPEHLAELLHADSDTLREIAAERIAQLDDASAAVLAEVLGDNDPCVRCAAIKRLARMPTESLRRALLREALHEDDPLLRSLLGEVLGHAEPPENEQADDPASMLRAEDQAEATLRALEAREGALLGPRLRSM